MKQILFLIVFFIIGCSQSPMKETIIRESTNNGSNLDYKLINEPMYPISAKYTLKNFLKKFDFDFGQKLYAGNGNGYIDIDALTKQNDFVECKVYYDNSTNSNDVLYQNVWRTLDLSDKIGQQIKRVVLYVKVIDCGADGTNEYAKFNFRTPGSFIVPKTLQQKRNDTLFYTAEVTTDTNGCVEWSYSGVNPYDAKTAAADPDYHKYQWLKCQIWLLESWKVDIN